MPYEANEIFNDSMRLGSAFRLARMKSDVVFQHFSLKTIHSAANVYKKLTNI
jgi:hypothetical protein